MINRPVRNDLDEKTSKNMTTRIVTGIVLAVIAVPAILLGGWFFIALIAVALIIATHEFINAPQGKKYPILLNILLYIMIFSFVFWVFIRNNITANASNGFPIFDVREWDFGVGFNDILISTMGVAVAIFVLFAFSIFKEDFKMTDVNYLFTMLIFIGIGFQSFLFLRFFPYANFESFRAVFGTDLMHETGNYIQSSLLFIYIVIGTIFNDIGAYFIGVFFGKNKMNARVSPNKTWEGFWGGVGTSFIFSFLFAIIMAAIGYPILPWLDLDGWYLILFISLLMPFFANLGDFSFSSIKREFNIKDYGTILRGMGGILDRIDSLLTVSFGISIIIILISNIILTGNPFSITPQVGMFV